MVRWFATSAERDADLEPLQLPCSALDKIDDLMGPRRVLSMGNLRALVLPHGPPTLEYIVNGRCVGKIQTSPDVSCCVVSDCLLFPGLFSLDLVPDS